jgi:2-polyprenyl-3-methyl-5-hydroxy-6-metoxy-1,4-benzoquinol methylase
MAFIRIKHCDFEETYNAFGGDTFQENEWDDDCRIDEGAWKQRYDYEGGIINSVIEESDSKTILEIGSGPGTLCDTIFKLRNDKLTYHMLDKKYAKVSHQKRNYAGEMFVNDLNDGINTEPLLDEGYDMIVCNDVLEHLANPTQIVQQLYHLNTGKGKFFVSIPNWRMGHQMTYRGMWDYDNFLYFMAIHGYVVESVVGSPLITPDYPKLDSEECLDDSMLRSWNWYFVFGKDFDFVK